ncbi:MAG: hypothetical protein F6K21_09400 [Symploca sp. SIO2D2]|nr:hypothetical protein [Symploca sp. SIO2D2]
MAIPELKQQLLQLSLNDKLYIIQLLAQSLTAAKVLFCLGLSAILSYNQTKYRSL